VDDFVGIGFGKGPGVSAQGPAVVNTDNHCGGGVGECLEAADDQDILHMSCVCTKCICMSVCSCVCTSECSTSAPLPNWECTATGMIVDDVSKWWPKKEVN